MTKINNDKPETETLLIPTPKQNAEWRLNMFTRRCYDALAANPTFDGGKAIHVEIIDIEEELVDQLISLLRTDGYHARRRAPNEGTHPYLLICPSNPQAAAIEHLTLQCISQLRHNQPGVDIGGVDDDDDVVNAVTEKLRAAGWLVNRWPLGEGTPRYLVISPES